MEQDSMEEIEQSGKYGRYIFFLILITVALLVAIVILFCVSRKEPEIQSEEQLHGTKVTASPEEVRESEVNQQTPGEEPAENAAPSKKEEESSTAESVTEWQKLQSEAVRNAHDGNYGAAYQKAVQARKCLTNQEQTDIILKEIKQIDDFLIQCAEHLDSTPVDNNKGNSIR